MIMLQLRASHLIAVLYVNGARKEILYPCSCSVGWGSEGTHSRKSQVPPYILHPWHLTYLTLVIVLL